MAGPLSFCFCWASKPAWPAECRPWTGGSQGRRRQGIGTYDGDGVVEWLPALSILNQLCAGKGEQVFVPETSNVATQPAHCHQHQHHEPIVVKVMITSTRQRRKCRSGFGMIRDDGLRKVLRDTHTLLSLPPHITQIRYFRSNMGLKMLWSFVFAFALAVLAANAQGQPHQATQQPAWLSMDGSSWPLRDTNIKRL